MLTGNLEGEKMVQSNETMKLQQRLEELCMELLKATHDLALAKSKKHELETKLKESQQVIKVLTIGAEKVTKMINFGKLSGNKTGTWL